MKLRRIRKRKQIDISSLIDVLFILLIFLMVSVRFTETKSYVELDLPKSENSSVGDFDSQIILSLDRNGQWYWNGIKKSKEELSLAIQSGKSFTSETKVILEIDKISAFGDFFEIVTKLKNRNINQIEIATKLQR
ncbi:ExbD/TolR family protein [Leptospira sp. 'Mane']|uniref:ExbD/TolR family protein n=1 Tax=Leptospira sp. 'Mane' TaxID=3387407 RepID=UPI00398AB72D